MLCASVDVSATQRLKGLGAIFDLLLHAYSVHQKIDAVAKRPSAKSVDNITVLDQPFRRRETSQTLGDNVAKTAISLRDMVVITQNIIDNVSVAAAHDQKVLFPSAMRVSLTRLAVSVPADCSSLL